MGLLAGFLLAGFSAVAQPTNPPNISSIPDQGIFPNSTNRLINFIVTDAETPANLLSLAGLSSNTNVVPNSGIVFGGSGNNRTLTIIPATNRTGTTTITIAVTDANGESASNSFLARVEMFTEMTTPLVQVGRSAVAWGDYDNDGRLDIAIGGTAGTGIVTRLYHNDGNWGFTETTNIFPGVDVGAVTWGDYDRDGDLDLLLAGGTADTNNYYIRITALYRNDGAGQFTRVAVPAPDVVAASLAWGDYDNDGDLDILLTGLDPNLAYRTVVCRNLGGDQFELVPTPSLAGVYGGSGTWGDYDNDGDLDILLTGYSPAVGWLAKIFRNDGNAGFTDSGAVLTGSGAVWEDYDRDGDLDVISGGGYFRNDGNNNFTNIAAGLGGPVASGDFDNDGDLDVFSGRTLFQNNGGGIFSTVLDLGPTNASAAAWADIDNDGDLDLIVTGSDEPFASYRTIVFRNNLMLSNTPPSAPTGLNAAQLTNGIVSFGWATATDAQTPSAGLGYNLRVGTSPGGVQIIAPQADVASGFGRVPQTGMPRTNRWKLIDLPKGTYYWSLQAIDTSLARSRFATEKAFTITNTAPTIQVITEIHSGPSLSVAVPFMVGDAESSATQLQATAQSANNTFIPPASIVVTGTGTNRTVSFKIGAGQYGTNDLIVRVTDPGGLTQEGQIRVVSELFSILDIPASTNFLSLVGLRIGWGYPFSSPVVDVDRDGDLDVLMQGTILSNNYVVSVFVVASNGGSGNFSLNILTNVELPAGVDNYALDDFNHDGVVDLLAGGSSYYASSTIQLLAGNGTGSFVPAQNLGTGYANMFSDIDGDGDLDGLSFSSWYQNDGGLLHLRPGPPLLRFDNYTEPNAGRAADIDGDGDVDFFMPGPGTNSAIGLQVTTFKNSGRAQFTSEMFPILGPATLYGIRAYDANDDGRLDVGFSYETNYSGPILPGLAASDSAGHFYLTTTNIAPGLLGSDFDNDGDIDRWVGEYIHSDPYTEHTRLYLKAGPGQYVPQSLSLSEPGFEGDFDGDGDLDYIAPTELWDGYGQVASPKQWRFFRNNTDHTNAPPTVPTGLTATQRNDDRVTFAWNAATDDHTPTNFVSYNLRVGTTPGGIDVLAPCANTATGRRLLSAAGNAGPLTFHDLRSLPAGTYYWSVQAIDGVFASSSWATEKSLTIVRPSISALPDIVTPPGITSKPISFSVTGGSSPVSALNITAVADDPTLLPPGGLTVTGTGTQRTLTILPGASSGDTELTVTATDIAGFSAVRRCHVRVAWWDPQQNAPLAQLGIQRYEDWHWADMDADGWLDILGYTPVGNSTPQIFAFRNLGGGLFATNFCSLPSAAAYPIQVAGFGGDNVPDVLMFDRPTYDNSSFRIWKGVGGGFQFLPLTEVVTQSAVWNHLWVDLDNDGWRDLVHFGWTNSPSYGLLIAHGNADGTFSYLPQRISMSSGTSIAVGDFDSDGDFDLAVSGTDGGTNFTRLYLNVDHGQFVPDSAGLPQGSYIISAADVDGDSRPDLLLNPSDTSSTNHPHLMHNVGGSFVEIASSLATELEHATWADYDNDGDLDLLGITSAMLSIGADQYRAAFFRNDGGVLTRADTGLPSIVAHEAEFADADNDGDLDLLISGETGWNQTARYLCLNTSPKTNTPPPTPANPFSSPGNTSTLLQWTPVPDAESGTALTYNLRLGTSPGGSEIVSPVADTSTGRRRLTGPGNIGETPRRRLLLPDGTYYWSVQAVDAGFAASPFTAERSFTCYHPVISSLAKVRLYPGAGPAQQSFTVGDTDSTASSLVMSASSSDPSVLPVTNIIFGGSASNRTVSVKSAAGIVGTSVVSVVVMDVTGLRATNNFVLESAYFTEIATGFSGGNNQAAAFADYDNDGDLDFYLGGIIYRNNGAGNFSNVATVTATAQRNGVAWGDYDRDGDLDLAVVGASQTIIYRNDGANVFTDIGAGIQAAGNAAIAWGDYDNDGDLDLLSLAADGNGYCRIYRNDGASGFTAINLGIAGAGESGIAWGDFDNDGDLDLLISGFRGPSTAVGAIYRNNGSGGFSDIGAGIAGMHGSAVAWGDYDNDGFLDAVVAGVWSTFPTHIYHNNQNGTFTETNAGLPGAAYGSVQWVDFDNDGDLDLLLSGNTSNVPNLDYATYLFRNNGDGTFTDTLAGLPKASIAAWGDIDADSDLDLLLSGDPGATYRFFRNDCAVTNMRPTTPAGLIATLLPDNNVMLSWSLASDFETTNATSLSYAVRAGLVPSGTDLRSPHADPINGFRRLPERGPFNTTNLVIRDVPRGTYYWSVQSIDATWAGSSFAAEKTFTITNSRPVISAIANQANVPGRTVGPLDFTVSDFETPAASLLVTASSLNTNLFPMTNLVLGGAGTNRTVTLTPASNQSGSATVVLSVTDAGGLIATSRFDVVVQTFTDIIDGLPIVTRSGASAWADYDNDGDLDIALSGSGVSFTTVYRNTNGVFTNQNFNLPNRFLADLAWLDVDRDGDLDLLESGWESTSGYIATNYFFRNNFAANSFTTLGFAGLTNIADGTMAWGDYDNDGDLDLFLSGDPNKLSNAGRLRRVVSQRSRRADEFRDRAPVNRARSGHLGRLR